MRPSARIIGLAALAVAALAGAAAAEAPPLKRLTLRQDVLGFEAVGRVEIGAQGYCTGALIAPDLVLTAAHCLRGGSSDEAPDIAGMRFRAGLRDGVAVAESGVARAVGHPRYDPANPKDLDSVRHDVALLELAEPIPAATAAPFAIARLGNQVRQIDVVSFAKGRDAALSWQDGCRVVGRDVGLIAFDCDVHFGSSGAPVFDRSAGRPRIVAIIAAGTREEGKVVSVGMELEKPVAELRRALRTGQGVLVAGGSRRIEPRRILPGTKADTGARFVRP
ncbi:trypsin-like peptidase domain-containing protein [Defluviimonas sp. D31]|uniref:trypsin-like serine peptidase n=1 Tax=Defluviimonas sp. D31 TaxID=3083253 RepID=UPI00296F8622|nr:trypsin-like peptidase domain-containing protein [Defluviimonas sp. D31]MDW4549949.1 trypsin-like peptidase domain-containing protein [Defluviimonas sp. D31]